MDFIIVGLGNPGKRYAFTRHNVGWIALDYITEKLGVKTNKLKFKSLCGETTVNGKKVLFLKPQTFMNYQDSLLKLNIAGIKYIQ